jgi:hypothetical protein
VDDPSKVARQLWNAQCCITEPSLCAWAFRRAIAIEARNVSCHIYRQEQYQRGEFSCETGGSSTVCAIHDMSANRK